jgi:hypothetical protein
MRTIYNSIFLFFISLATTFANPLRDFEFSKEKNIEKVYSVNADATVNVSNSYGNINVYLWDENKISIQVTIKVSGNNESKVTEKLNSIDVNFSASQSAVNAETTFENKKWSNGSNMSYEINYIIKLPRKGNVDLVNKYGNINIDKLHGISTIKCQYGNVNLGDFKNKQNTISLAYADNSTINFIENLNLKSQYSKITIQKGDQITINGNYNNFKLGTVDYLSLSSNYTKINTSGIEKFTGTGNYLTLKLGDIGNSATVLANYSSIALSTDKNTKSIIIAGNYSGSTISCPQNYAFDFDIALKYGSLKDNLGLKFSEKSEKNNAKTYNGYNISSGKSKITVSSSYGNVQLINK